MTSAIVRPVLAPGLRVLRHSRDQLQVGLDPGRRVLLPDTEPVRRTLGHLLRGEAVPDDRETRPVLDRLAPVLVDGTGLVAPDVDPGDVAALALQDPASYQDRLAARRRTSVAVTGALGSVEVRPLLAAAGLPIGRPVGEGPGAAATLVLSVGELDRTVLDPLVRSGTAHLVVRLVEGRALVGPFVEPGRTACLRCIDAHQTLADPRAPTLAARHAQAADDRHDGVAEPVDTALATLALAWAVRDLVTRAEGDRPATWSTTIDIAGSLASISQVEWLRHPACGCSWLRDEALSSTMEG